MNQSGLFVLELVPSNFKAFIVKVCKNMSLQRKAEHCPLLQPLYCTLNNKLACAVSSCASVSVNQSWSRLIRMITAESFDLGPNTNEILLLGIRKQKVAKFLTSLKGSIVLHRADIKPQTQKSGFRKKQLAGVTPKPAQLKITD